MPERTIEDRLREEYFDLLPEIRRVVWQLETEIRFLTLPILHNLKSPEQLEIKSRIKDCQSALNTLARKKEGRKFDPEKPGGYSMLDLPDLAGVRVLVFPNTRLREVEAILQPSFQGWVCDPVKDDSGTILAPKYNGHCPLASSRVRGEYQIVPMLLGLFWEVEHAAMYKFRPAANSKLMRDRRTAVERSLSDFEAGIQSFLEV